ncbi:MAG: CTP synthase [Verrucomicrobia bacterium]|nr:CTP synthase [Verrucomicrobiota bacterium]MBS0647410.1 CTP synthase [Verrucomicrobiota bacterium]
MRKYLFVTGGVVSSLGKGLTMASVAMLLEKKGIRLAMLKLDPYLNIDPGTMNPFEHGEVYVTDDGAETDLDLGHYYRYTHSPLSRASIATSGQIYDTVIKKERHGDYLGKTVQVIPHITDEIKRRIAHCGEVADAELVLVEIGGTVGDIESLPFLEAIRQFRHERPHNCLNIHMTYVPYLKAAGEVKTKPTQHSIQTLRGIGIIPDLIICRCEQPLSREIKDKIGLFANLSPQAIFEAIDVKHSIYEVPLTLHRDGIDARICKELCLPNSVIDLSAWQELVKTVISPKGTLTIGIVGKYLQHQDAYKSIFEALEHGALAAGYSLNIRAIESDKEEMIHELSGCDGCLVPGGFGERGWEGKIAAARYCREHNLPYFGICLGMQVLAVEFARHVMGHIHANSTEMDPHTKMPVISLLSEMLHREDLGGTMRLGAYQCLLQEGSKAHAAYGTSSISERHRHRYEFNNRFKQEAEGAGLVFSGMSQDGSLCEIAEIRHHPWMVGVQFHPEFKSRPTQPHPLFRDFIAAAAKAKSHD